MNRRKSRLVSPLLYQEPGHASQYSWPLWTQHPSLASGNKPGEGSVGGSNSSKRPFNELTVAIIEDNLDMSRAYTAYLRKRGFHAVHTFETGEDFAKAVLQKTIAPEIALVDFRLPGMDGIETAVGVVKLSPRLKVIVTTADDSIVTRVNSNGFRFLQKPFSLSALLRAMDDVRD